LIDENWRIFARHFASSPQYIGKEATVENSLITEGCEIYGTVKNSVLGTGVKVLPGAVVEDSVVLENTVIGNDATVQYSVLASNVCVGANATVGAKKSADTKIAVVGEDVQIPTRTTIADGAMIYEL
jgi:glucose-1-phosphate adenylyltransferase